MSPYRNAPPPPSPPIPDGGDDHVLLILNLSIALLRLVPAVVTRERWGVEPTVALLIALVCVSLLVRSRYRKHRKDDEDHGDR